MTQQTTQTVTVDQAAALLKTTTAAIRKRIKRGSLEAIKDADGRWQVELPVDILQDDGLDAGRTGTGRGTVQTEDTGLDAEQALRLTQLEVENGYLKRELADRTVDRDRWQQQADRWQQQADQAMTDARETRRMALVYAPRRKQRELAALLGTTEVSESIPRIQKWIWWTAGALLVGVASVAIWLFIRYRL